MRFVESSAYLRNFVSSACLRNFVSSACLRKVVPACLAAGMLVGVAAAANWPQFRGPDGTGAVQDGSAPTEWTAEKNVLWKTPLPGPGASSPITFNGKVYVVCYSGYGVDPMSPGSESDLVRHLICLDEATGKELWKTDIPSEMTPEARFQGMMTQHGYASNSPATDGQKIYLFLGTAGAYAFDMDGKKLWNTKLGSGSDGWGSAASPVMFEDLVIIPATIESQQIVGLKKDSGEIAWKKSVPRRSWSTPAVVAVDGRHELVVNSEGKVLGLDPKTGAELWTCQGIGDYTCPSVVAGKGVAYVTGARRNELLAIKCGGNGDVSATHVLWTKTVGANVTTPVLVGDRLYGVKENGTAYCVNVADGKLEYEGKRLGSGGGNTNAGNNPPPRPPMPMGGFGRRRGFGGGGFGSNAYASLVAAGDKLYAVMRASGTYVIAAKPEFEVLAHNTLEGDSSNFDGTPAVSNGRLLLRSNKAIYCIAQPK